MMELSRYIHLNPVRAGMVAKPEEYPWSSYRDYVGTRQAACWLCTETVTGRIGDAKRYREFVEDLLRKEYESPLQGAFASSVLGSEPFVQEITAMHFDGKEIDREVPAIRELSKSRKIEMILRNLTGVFGDIGLEQKAAIYLSHRYSGARLKEIGSYFGKKESAISQVSRRFAAEMENDGKLAKMVVSLVEKLKLS
jgi:putative transposase